MQQRRCASARIGALTSLAISATIGKSAKRKAPMQTQTVDEFIVNLLNEKGITDLEPDVKEQLVADLKAKLLQQIDREAILRLDADKADELSNLLDDPNFTSEQMAQFLQDAGVDLTAVALDTMLKFRTFYLGTEA